MNNREPRELPLKTVGRQVLFIQTDDRTVRVGEGAFLSLRDGRILHAYTEYCGGDIHDNGEANIVGIFSHDGGETWGQKRLLISRGDAVNIMSVSLLRLDNGEILIFYLRKSLVDGVVVCRPCVRSSFDECETFGPERCIAGEGDTFCYVVNNDRICQLQSGRLLIAAARLDRGQPRPAWGEEVCYLASDDRGATWQSLDTVHRMPFDNTHGYEEPGYYQHRDGTIWSYYRTDIGCQFETVSTDDGQTWSNPKPNIFFTSARSPMLVKRVCEDKTLAIFNPISLYRGRNLGGIRGRAPYLLAVSDTDGVGHDKEAFARLYFVETDMDNDYSYPAILDLGDSFLLAYYHSNGRERPLNCLKIVKVMKDEICQ